MRAPDVALIARAGLISTAHFSWQFRTTYGETPYAYLMPRIERLKALLRHGELWAPKSAGHQLRRPDGRVPRPPNP